MPRAICDDRRAAIRARFPALSGPTVFLENAGGSQVPAVVADRMREYLLTTFVQLGASYELSRRASAAVEEARAFARLLLNGDDGEVILGPSTTTLLHLLGEAYGRRLAAGDEVIVAEAGHEANVGPWVALERLGVRVRWWRMGADRRTCPIDALDAMLSERTALVALPHVSNLLGEIVDLAEVVERSHAVGARVVADGVAFAPHRVIDVAAWGVDWYVYSAYKVYGPHLAVLWGRREALEELDGPNHFFLTGGARGSGFELGGPNHEACAGLLALADYLRFLADSDPWEPLDRSAVEAAFGEMTACELPLQERLVGYLAQRDDVVLLGPAHGGSERVGTVSFVHRSRSSRAVVADIDHTEITLRHGHMYAYRLCRALGLDPEDGVVRASLVHYNTPQEIERLIEVLDVALR